MSEIVLEQNIDIAAQYLACNQELRECLTIAQDAVLIPEPLGVGEHNLNYKFTDSATGTPYVLRINIVPQPFHKDQVAYEAAALRALEPSGRTPVVYYVDSSRTWFEYGALVTSFCVGDELDFDNLAPGDLDVAAHIMADIHSVDVTQAQVAASLYHPQDPLQEMYDEAVARFKAYLSGGFEDARLTAWCERMFAEARKIIEDTPPATGVLAIINTETLPSHFLIMHTQEHRHAGYMIDWERPMIGEPAQDVAYFVSPTSTFWDSDYLFPSAHVDGFLQTYIDAVDGRIDVGNFYERFKAYRAMTALRSTTWCCRALARYSKDSGEYKNEKTERKLSTYLSDEFLEGLLKECLNGV